VDVHRPGLAGKVGAPDALEEHVTGEDDARVAGERREKVELPRPKVKTTVPDRRLASARVDPEGADLDRAASPDGHVRPPHDRLDSRHEGSRIERLRDVIVRAELESDDRIDVVVASREHEDRRVPAPPELAAHLEAVDPREHQVEDDEVRLVAPVELQAVLAVARCDDRPALLLQVQPDELDDVALVVDDQDRLHPGEDTLRGPARAGRM
jgi:hypothetical protein